MPMSSRAPNGPEPVGRRRARGTSTRVPFLAVVLGATLGLFLMAPASASAFDTDSDGIVDVEDNCIDVPNGLSQSSQLDSDADGFGNACDSDLNNDGFTGIPDVVQVFACLWSVRGDPGPADDPECRESDLNGNGLVEYSDLGVAWRRLLQPPGPSGLGCADATALAGACYVADSSADTDGDSIANRDDNCALVANFFAAPAPQRDSDHDGVGNACDGDFDNDGIVDGGLPGIDDDRDVFDDCFGQFVPGNSGWDEDPGCFESDMDASGFVDAADFSLLQATLDAGVPGPSGLDCANPAATAPVCLASAGQQPDPHYFPVLEHPVYAPGTGPVVKVDATHGSLHTIADRFQGFSRLIEADGYSVSDFAEPFDLNPGCLNDLAHCDYFMALLEVDVLVISNAETEISEQEAEVLAGWVDGTLDASVGCLGGCTRRRLLVSADHTPYPARVSHLAAQLGVAWADSNMLEATFFPDLPCVDLHIPSIRYNCRTLEASHPIALGQAGYDEAIDAVTTFSGSRVVGTTPASLAGSVLRLDLFGWSQGIAFDFGSGRVYASAEGGMFTAQVNSSSALGMQILGRNENQQFLLNLMHWLDRLE